MPLSAGIKLGPYQIIAPLGAGGMGEVYRARDTRLDRTVAVKILKGPHTDRFEREGLARFDAPRIPDASTVTDLTADGTVLGTVPYMAPEQLRGQLADARSDIFSFGAVLFEMITGRRAFPGQTQADLIGAILERDLPTSTELPPELEWIVRSCLVKDPDERWQTARDLCRALQHASPAP